MNAATKKSIKADLATVVADQLRKAQEQGGGITLVGSGATVTSVGTTGVGIRQFDVTVERDGEVVELQVKVTEDL